MPRPLDLLYRNSLDTQEKPVRTNYRTAARRLAPLVDRMANGDPLTLTQLADVTLAGWQLLDGLTNDPYQAGLLTE